ncbi:MAG: DUF1127 domain-containing protein [Planktomarina temperata]|uniref:DUF1127 domain-containing protein n=1 Tax=Planktomarina temperata TaxID=1284658 RepID=UPI003C7576FF
MATIVDVPQGNRIAAGLNRVLSGFLNFLVSISTAQSRVRQIEFLGALSDEELAQRGLTRQDIVRHVYRDAYYI